MIANVKFKSDHSKDILVPIPDCLVGDPDDLISEVETQLLKIYSEECHWNTDFEIENYQSLCQKILDDEVSRSI